MPDNHAASEAAASSYRPQTGSKTERLSEQWLREQLPNIYGGPIAAELLEARGRIKELEAKVADPSLLTTGKLADELKKRADLEGVDVPTLLWLVEQRRKSSFDGMPPLGPKPAESALPPPDWVPLFEEKDHLGNCFRAAMQFSRPDEVAMDTRFRYLHNAVADLAKVVERIAKEVR